jgi:hypothetical protein
MNIIQALDDANVFGGHFRGGTCVSGNANSVAQVGPLPRSIATPQFSAHHLTST